MQELGTQGGPDIALDVWVMKSQEVTRNDHSSFSLLSLATQTLKAASGSLCDLFFEPSGGWPHQDFARVTATAVTLSSSPVVTLTESPFISSVNLADLPSNVMMAEAGTMNVCSFPPFRPEITSFP